MQNLGKKAVRGSFSLFVATSGGFAIRLAANMFLARLIAPEEFGAYALATVYAELLGMVTAFGLPLALVQLEEGFDALFDTVIILTMALTGGLFVVSIGIYPIVSWLNGADVAGFFMIRSASRIVTGSTNCMSSQLQRRFKYGTLSILQVISTAIGVSSAVSLAFAGAGAGALVARDVVPTALISLAMLVMMRRRYGPIGRTFSRRTAKAVWKLGKGLFTVRASELLQTYVDQLVVGIALGKESLGFYERARYLAILPNAGLGPASTAVSLRTFSVLMNDKTRLARVHDLLQFALARVVIPAGIVFVLAPSDLVSVLYGKGWEQTSNILPYLAGMAVIMPLFSNNKELLLATRQWRPLVAAIIVRAILGGIGGLSLSYVMGGKGVGMAASISAFVALLMVARANSIRLGVKARVYKGAVLAGILAVTCGIVTSEFFFLGAMKNVAAVMVAALMYIGLLFALDGKKLTGSLSTIKRNLLG